MIVKGWFAIYYRELLILKRKFFRQAASMSVAPLLYLVAFGLGMGRNVTVDGHSYMEFLVPGLVTMTSMTQAFAIGVEINVARFYWHIFDEFQSAPIPNLAYVIGEVLAGITRALLSSAIAFLLRERFPTEMMLPKVTLVNLAVNGTSLWHPGPRFSRTAW